MSMNAKVWPSSQSTQIESEQPIIDKIVRRITQASQLPIVRLDFIAATPCEPVAVGWSLYAGWLTPTHNYLKVTKTRCDVKIESDGIRFMVYRTGQLSQLS